MKPLYDHSTLTPWNLVARRMMKYSAKASTTKVTLNQIHRIRGQILSDLTIYESKIIQKLGKCSLNSQNSVKKCSENVTHNGSPIL